MKVIKCFTDKYTKKRYEVGDKFDGTKERAKELQEKGFLEIEKEATKKAK